MRYSFAMLPLAANERGRRAISGTPVNVARLRRNHPAIARRRMRIAP